MKSHTVTASGLAQQCRTRHAPEADVVAKQPEAVCVVHGNVQRVGLCNRHQESHVYSILCFRPLLCMGA